MKNEYFLNIEDQALFNTIKSFVIKYNTLPSQESLLLDIESEKNITDEAVKNIKKSIVDVLANTEETPFNWLIDNTEKFCQDKAVYIAMTEAISIMEGNSKTKDSGVIPKLLQDALAVSFDTHVGHDYFQDSDERFEYYHRVENKHLFDLDFLNKATNGGITDKTLNVIIGGTGVGKTLSMCHLASSYLNQGKNVLYITMEMAEEEISKRIDANLLDITFADLMAIPKDIYDNKIGKLKNRTNGKLIVKEYPTAGASVIHFRGLLKELFLKKSFKPDIIIIDYINICASARLKPGRSSMYEYVKSIAEELRGLAVEEGVPIWTATQLNREGFGSSDPDLTHTSESFGLPATADLMWIIVRSEQLDKLNQIMVIQAKSRYGDIALLKRFVLGIDRSKMKLYNVEQSAQEDLVDTGQENDTPVMDKKNEKFKKWDI